MQNAPFLAQPPWTGGGDPSLPAGSDRLEARELDELAVALLDVVAGDARQPVHAERLDGERGHRRPMHKGTLDPPKRQVAGRGEVAHEAAGERVASAGRVLDVFQEQRWRPKDALLGHQDDAVLALLDD